MQETSAIAQMAAAGNDPDRSGVGSPLLDGCGFAFAMIVLWIAAWTVGLFFGVIPSAGAVGALRIAGLFAAEALLDTLPMVPLFIILANRSQSWRRYLWLLGAMPIFFVYWGIIPWLDGSAAKVIVSPSLPCIVMGGLACAAVTYRSSARSAKNEFIRREIDDAMLAGEVKRARLQLLRAQIEPHFLFNTLATVRSLARVDRAGAVRMIDNLLRYLAEALPKFRQEQCSLADELQLIDAYLHIHQVRIGARLTYELSVPPELQTCRVPTMLLLTLVENAIKHGINPAVDGGSIRVSAGVEKTALVLKVSDTGQGMTATEGHGAGLSNIRQRLLMLYGEEAMLTLGRIVPRGVVATISIPAVAA